MPAQLDIAQMHSRIRDMLASTGGIANAASLGDDDNIYDAGLTAFTAVQLMLALEEAFGVKFPRHMLNRHSFGSIHAIEACVTRLLPEAGAH